MNARVSGVSHAPTPRCHNSSLSFFLYLKGQSQAAPCFEIPGVIYRLGISSLPSPFRPESLHRFFFFLLFLVVFFITTSPWFCLLIKCQGIEKASERGRGFISRGGGRNKQAVACLTRPSRMSLPLFRDVFHHAGLYVSLPGHSPVSPCLPRTLHCLVWPLDSICLPALISGPVCLRAT